MRDCTEGSGETRTCPKCGETKPIEAYSRSKQTTYGRQSRCKECKKAEARAGYAKNIEHYREYHRKKMADRHFDPKNWVDVTCIDCGKTWSKWKASIPTWQGRCGSCSAIQTLSNPAIREMLAEKARIQLANFPGGKIPNSGKNVKRGEDHYNWKGGVTPEHKRQRATIECVRWRKAIYARDNYTCYKCGQVGGKLHAHHIKPWAEYPDLRFDLSNGVTMCKECHQLLHAEEAGRRLGKARDEGARRRRELSSAA